jgi:hypothetical protein
MDVQHYGWALPSAARSNHSVGELASIESIR